ncbi:NAD(P)/FAD-dependent oxidoreductase [Plastoroseomonas arctica]|uniref:FAD-binding oxidoreductase n=1 Tax=Plastoroseomonas arctica TaxID=1509237 RepID=A0AAF1K5W5_9PROT|nr:FAD-dependent oxidoreductase [Plastoroseomonas arctica]MBR0656526.1 FAD-binding oxidoreductase [Plastoroseomonas arctica]
MDLHRFDAIVVGAGIAGATAAAHLAPTRRVALIEAEESAGYHTTGRSAAIWILNYGPADVRALSGASRAFFEASPAGFPPLARPRAIVSLAPPDQQARLAAMLADGVGMQAIAVAEVAAMVPPLRPGYAVAAAIERDAFDIDVAALHQGFLRVVQALGGTLALRSRAGRIWHANGAWHAETSSGAVFAAPILVNAAGAWGDEVAGIADVATLGLQPKRRTALIIDPGPYDCADWPLVGDAGHSWYLRPEARRKLMLSPADETDSSACDARPEEIDIAIAIDRMQQALDIPVTRVEHSWAGLRTFTPDGSLAIGPGRAPGFHWMCGQGGYGMQTAPAAGALLAHLIDGTDPGALTAIIPAVNPLRFEAS